MHSRAMSYTNNHFYLHLVRYHVKFSYYTNMKKTLPSILALFVLLSGLGAGIILVQNQQDIRGRAAEPDITTQKIVELANQIDKSQNANVETYQSSFLGYEIRVNTNLWEAQPGTDITRVNLPNLSFNLKSGYGGANVQLRVFENSDYQAALVQKSSSTETPLESVANYYQDNPDLPEGATIAEKKIVQKNGKPAYRFTINQTILGVETQFYQYLVVSTDKYYVITANYPSSLKETAILTESFIDEFIFSVPDAAVQGASDAISESQILDEVKIAELTKPSVVNIVTLYCNSLSVNNSSGLKYLKSSYQYCDGAKGSGFFISESGHVGTNGHVVKVYPEMSMVSGIQSGSLRFFLIDLVKEMTFQREGLDITDQQALGVLAQTIGNPQTLQALLVGMYEFLDQGVMSITEGQTKYYVKLGNDPLVFDEAKIKAGDVLNSITPSSQIKEAKLIAFDFPNSLSVDAVLHNATPQGSDVAIIKIDDASLAFPSLKLGDSSLLKDGSSLLVIGYPGLVEGSQSDSSLISFQSSGQPTITRGVVSSIKTDNAGRKLIQTDASIDHGNSGGPAFNDQGEVVGLATYGFLSQSGNYNFLRDIADLKELANQNNIALTESSTYISWETGLFYFWDSFYKKSVVEFETIQEEYPIHPSVGSYISDAQVAIQDGKDKGGIFGTISPTVVNIVIGIVVVAGLGGLIFVIAKKRKPGSPVSTVLQVPATPSVVTPPTQVPPQPTTPNLQPTPTPQTQTYPATAMEVIGTPQTPIPSPAQPVAQPVAAQPETNSTQS